MLEGAIYQAEKMKRDYKDKLAEEDVKTLDEAVEAAKKVSADEKADKEALELAGKELSDKIMPIGAKMYESAQADGATDGAKDDGSDDDDDKKSDGKSDTVEGEVVDEDKKDK